MTTREYDFRWAKKVLAAFGGPKALREQCKVTQVQIATMCARGQSRISQIENGPYEITGEVAYNYLMGLCRLTPGLESELRMRVKLGYDDAVAINRGDPV